MFVDSTNNIYSTQKTAFGSHGQLKRNLRLGETVLYEFKKEFPYLESSSFIHSKVRYHIKALSSFIMRKGLRLEEKAFELDFKMHGLARHRVLHTTVKRTLSEFVRQLKSLMKEKKSANCDYDACCIFSELKKKKVKPRCLQLKVVDTNADGRLLSNHYTTVIGLEKNAKIEDPKTWGPKAVIVDGWADIVMPAREALDYLASFLGYNPAKGESLKLEPFSLRHYLVPSP